MPDYDIDAILLTDNDLLVEKAKECLKFPTPIKLIDSVNVPKKLNSTYAAELDFILSKNLIGEVINLSQILNSYYWQEYHKKNANKDTLDLIYEKISLLSSLSQVEIDKAKKTFENLDVAKELEKIKEIRIKEKLLVQKEEVYEKKTIDNIKSEVRKEFLTATQDEIKDKINKKYKEYLDSKIDEDFLYEIEKRCKKHKKEIEKLSDEDKKENKKTKATFKKELKKEKGIKNKVEFAKGIRSEIRDTEKVKFNKLVKEACSEYYSNFDKLEKEYLETKDETLRDKLYICKHKQIRPKFFEAQLNEEDKKKNNYIYKNFETTMDYLIEVVDEIKKAKKMIYKKEQADIYIEELFKGGSKIGKSNRNQIQKIEEKAKEFTEEKNKLFLKFVDKLKNTDNKEEEYKKYKSNKLEKQEEFVEHIKGLKITEATIKSLICRMYAKKNKNTTDELSKYKLTIFATLYKAHTEKLLNMFKSTNNEYEELELDENGDIDIFGVKYKVNKVRKYKIRKYKGNKVKKYKINKK